MQRHIGTTITIPSHLRLFLTVLVVVFLAESVVMLILPFLFPKAEDSITATFTDALLLVLFISPFFWRFIVMPLRKSAVTEHARAATIIASASDAIITTDSKGLVRQFNHAGSRIFGYQEAELLGKDLTPLIPERYREAHRRGLGRLASGGRSQIVGKTVELDGLRKNGAEFPLELSITTWKAGKEMFFTGIIRDVSQRKQHEEALEREHKRLAMLHDINTAVTSTLDLRAVLDKLLDQIHLLLPYSASGWILMSS